MSKTSALFLRKTITQPTDSKDTSEAAEILREGRSVGYTSWIPSDL